MVSVVPWSVVNPQRVTGTLFLNQFNVTFKVTVINLHSSPLNVVLRNLISRTNETITCLAYHNHNTKRAKRPFKMEALKYVSVHESVLLSDSGLSCHFPSICEIVDFKSAMERSCTCILWVYFVPVFEYLGYIYFKRQFLSLFPHFFTLIHSVFLLILCIHCSRSMTDICKFTRSLTHPGCLIPMPKQSQNNKTFFGRAVFTTAPPQRVKLHPLMKSLKGMRES